MTLTFCHITDSQTTHYKSKGSQSRPCCSRLPSDSRLYNFPIKLPYQIFPKTDLSGAVRLVVNVKGKSGKYKSGVFDILTLLLGDGGELWHLRKSWPLCITDGPAMRPPLLRRHGNL